MKFDSENIKHISLDAWNTLLIPNEVYAKARAQMLARAFFCSEAMARDIYTSVKREADSRAEEQGDAYDTQWLYERLVSLFPPGHDITADALRVSYIEYLFNLYPPTILQTSIEEIRRLHDLGITFSISSNTNFISGKLLAPLIRKAIPEMSFMLFSDLMSMTSRPGMIGSSIKPAKPHPVFFDKVFHFAKLATRNPELKRDQILHIGDNRVCDFIGATNSGFASRLIDGVHELPGALKEL